MTKLENKTCPSCQSEINAKAKKCPHCQEDLRSWFRRHPILTLILVFMLLPVFTGLFSIPLTSDNNSSNTTPTKTREQVEAEEERRRLLVEETEQALEGYTTLINESGMNESVSNVEISNGTATITVRNNWHYRPKQIRLQATQTLWEAWVEFCPKEDADLCRVKIVDLNGNKVGGSKLFGSSIEVID